MEMEKEKMDREEITEKLYVDVRTILDQLGLCYQKWLDNKTPNHSELQ
ncbi:hypothetical protein [Cohnella thailandensis]|uniref:Uncharacterized protein n=1 Tax=Cohnella thailandensis TaxID=557557 RepID=A0A841SVV8_9BACL|nr:hypothetical protein [Cohnella thailandensis]MBB6635109.1 hypothetical protein [Cohnella thailandensis]MBP1974425.1 hypothetical protein [Cohnella thailandensis]